MGAGSPENKMGDAAISEEGIVQGHAYSVMDVRNLDGYKLIQLRNPHGHQGAEWLLIFLIYLFFYISY